MKILILIQLLVQQTTKMSSSIFENNAFANKIQVKVTNINSKLIENLDSLKMTENNIIFEQKGFHIMHLCPAYHSKI